MISPSLLALAISIISISVALPKVVKEIKEGAIVTHNIAGIIALNFANVNMALMDMPVWQGEWELPDINNFTQISLYF